jgi:hypothetical protein
MLAGLQRSSTPATTMWTLATTGRTATRSNRLASWRRMVNFRARFMTVLTGRCAIASNRLPRYCPTATLLLAPSLFLYLSLSRAACVGFCVSQPRACVAHPPNGLQDVVGLYDVLIVVPTRIPNPCGVAVVHSLRPGKWTNWRELQPAEDGRHGRLPLFPAVVPRRRAGQLRYL